MKIKSYSHSCPLSDVLGRSPFHPPPYGGEPGGVPDADSHSWPDHPELRVDKFLPQKADLNKQ